MAAHDERPVLGGDEPVRLDPPIGIHGCGGRLKETDHLIVAVVDGAPRTPLGLDPPDGRVENDEERRDAAARGRRVVLASSRICQRRCSSGPPIVGLFLESTQPDCRRVDRRIDLRDRALTRVRHGAGRVRRRGAVGRASPCGCSGRRATRRPSSPRRQDTGRLGCDVLARLQAEHERLGWPSLAEGAGGHVTDHPLLGRCAGGLPTRPDCPRCSALTERAPEHGWQEQPCSDRVARLQRVK